MLSAVARPPELWSVLTHQRDFSDSIGFNTDGLRRQIKQNEVKTENRKACCFCFFKQINLIRDSSQQQGNTKCSTKTIQNIFTTHGELHPCNPYRCNLRVCSINSSRADCVSGKKGLNSEVSVVLGAIMTKTTENQPSQLRKRSFLEQKSEIFDVLSYSNVIFDVR